MEEQQLVTVNAALKVRVPKHTKNVRRRFLSLLDAQRLIDSCQDQELKFALYFSIHTGARLHRDNPGKTRMVQRKEPVDPHHGKR
jgi:hypothetical protein